MRWILNSFPTPIIVLVFVGGTVALAIIGVLVARKLFPNLADGPFEETVDGLRVVYELVFALILAFVIGSVLDNFSTADSMVAAEAATIAHMTRANDALPIEQQLLLEPGLDQYVHAIVETEWEAMRHGEDSPRAAAALETVYALYESYSPAPADGVESDFYDKAVDQLPELISARRERLSLAGAELPTLLRIVLPIGVLLLLVLEYRPKMALRSQLVHMGMLALVVSFCYLLTILMDYPFSGDVAVGTDAFKSQALAVYWASDNPHVLATGETTEDLSPKSLSGVWHSDNYGVVLVRQVGDEIRAVYRDGDGTVVGRVAADGVFRGWWCEAPTRQPLYGAGDVEWRLVNTSKGEVVFGNWRYGSDEPLGGGWDLKKVGGPEPPDLARRFDDTSAFCPHP